MIGNMIKVVVLTGFFVLAGCGGGSSSTESADQARACTVTASASGGLRVTNNCDFNIQFRIFSGGDGTTYQLEPGEVRVISASGFVQFGICRSPKQPKERSGGFICD